jgi:hypothetical protein
MGGVQTDYIGNKYVDGAGCISSAGCLNYSNTHVFLANGNGADPNDQTGSPYGDNETGPNHVSAEQHGPNRIQARQRDGDADAHTE